MSDVLSEQKLSVIRKQLILRLCSRRVAQMLGLDVSTQGVQEVIDDFRAQRGLTTEEQFSNWLQAEGVTHQEFVRAMVDCALVNRIEQAWEHEIARELPSHLRMSSAGENKDTSDAPAGPHHSFSPNWLQINLAIQRQQGDALPSARAFFQRLSPALKNWRQHGVVNRFFFVRKPPDLRLRFLVGTTETHMLPELEMILSSLVRDGFVQRFFRSVYEPEFRQFGGIEAMEWVHRYFDADSMGWIALDRLASRGERTSSTEMFVLATMNDLFLRTLSCPEEVWDAWCNLASVMPSDHSDDAPMADIVLLESLLPSASPAEVQILQEFVSSNQQLANGLWQVWNGGRLQCGLRSILPFVAMFHFNRHGLNAATQAALAHAMSRAWNPKRTLRGASAGSCDNRTDPLACI